METVVGFGSLLSELSARSTFGGHLSNFRYAKVYGFRRIFSHTYPMFYETGIAKPETGEVCSLSTESTPDLQTPMIVSVFEIPIHHLDKFYSREEEYLIQRVDFVEIESGQPGQGLMCTSWNDEELGEKLGKENFKRMLEKHNLNGIWNLGEDSKALPCRVYLRHCVLSVKKAGEHILENFLDTTYLIDRTTKLKEYMEKNLDILDEPVPACLATRYNGDKTRTIEFSLQGLCCENMSRIRAQEGPSLSTNSEDDSDLTVSVSMLVL